MQESKAQIIGSSTACLMMLSHSDLKLYTTNIGDSGFLVVRRGEVVHRWVELADNVKIVKLLILKNRKRTFRTLIGDRVYMEDVFRSHEQQHYFNTPFQLSLPPTELQSEVLADR